MQISNGTENEIIINNNKNTISVKTNKIAISKITERFVSNFCQRLVHSIELQAVIQIQSKMSVQTHRLYSCHLIWAHPGK